MHGQSCERRYREQGYDGGYHRQVFNVLQSILHHLIRQDMTRIPGNGEIYVHAPGLCDHMDKIIKITLGIFIVILVAFTATVAFNAVVETAYRNSLASTYSYTLTLTTDSRLDNVTLFIPVPDDRTGNSPLVAQYSSHQIPQIPGSWKTILFDTGKATLVKISTPRSSRPMARVPVTRSPSRSPPR